ncbi:hypothetical protein WUBG_14929, partial [Wuchereria bancrofti]
DSNETTVLSYGDFGGFSTFPFFSMGSAWGSLGVILMVDKVFGDGKVHGKYPLGLRILLTTERSSESNFYLYLSM